MGTGLRFITVAFWIVLICTGLALAEEQSCLQCHQGHYQKQGTCTDCHLGRADTRRKELAHDRMLTARFSAFTLENNSVVEQGEKLQKKTACRRCHVSDGKGNKFAANLDWSPHNATADELFTAIREPAAFMPDFHFSDQQIVMLVNAIYAGSRGRLMPEEEVPVLIHFEDQKTVNLSIFEKVCGACHRMLTKQWGGLGSGFYAPNLSGLLTEFYPQTYPEKKNWTPQGIKDWVKNPRKLLKNARMSPVLLNEEEALELQKYFLDERVQVEASL